MTKNQQHMRKVMDVLVVSDPKQLFTDDRKEIIRIGETMLSSLPEVYNESTMKSFCEVIDRVLPSATEKEKREALTHAAYDYWMYGVNVKEEFFYGFDHKTHEEKDQYITFRSRYMYLYQISKEEDAHKLVDKYEIYCDLKPFVMWDGILFLQITDGCVLEGNFGAEFVQQTYLEKGFKEEFEELIRWKPESPFWWEA